MTTMTTAQQIADIFAAWDQEAADRGAGLEAVAEGVADILRAINGVADAYVQSQTMGSAYISMIAGEDEEFLTVRVSNHARKPNGHLAPAWSFEADHGVDRHHRGLEAIARSIASL